MSNESTTQIAYALTKRKKTCDQMAKKANPTSFNMTIKDLPEQYRPQNRLLLEGTMALSTAELLSLIIRSGSKVENAVNLSHRILSQFDLRQLSVAPISQIMEIHGIKEAKAAQIAACFEISRPVTRCYIMNCPVLPHPFGVILLRYASVVTLGCKALRTI